MSIVYASIFPLQAVNEEWLADKSRFSYDGLKTQRLAFPMVKDTTGELKAIEWADTLQVAANVLNNAGGQVGDRFLFDENAIECKIMFSCSGYFYVFRLSVLLVLWWMPKHWWRLKIY